MNQDKDVQSSLKKFQRTAFKILMLIFALTLAFSIYNHAHISASNVMRSFQHVDHRRLDGGIEWGHSFSGVSSTNVRKDNCPYFDTYEEANKIPLRVHHKRNCETTREYFPSDYELRHMEFAASVVKIENWQEEEYALLNFTSSPEELDFAVRWMARINAHMASDVIQSPHLDDTALLSRFIVTEKCEGHAPVKVTEYIEPLSIHGRDPFAYLNCEAFWKKDFYNQRLKPVAHMFKGIQSLDYVLLHGKGHARGLHNYYLFDAGTSRYDSGIWWLLCGYFQRGIEFDQVYGWEYTLLEPQDFWSMVPQKLVAMYHFFNAPISSNIKDRHSPSRIIKQIAREDDFVSYKLDVDTSNVELPIVQEMLDDAQLISLIDEFFFEFHIHCEVMKYCGWDTKEDWNGMKLNVESSMKMFSALRHKGLRAHFWP